MSVGITKFVIRVDYRIVSDIFKGIDMIIVKSV